MRVQHIRDDQELEPLFTYNNYDPRYQIKIRFKRVVKILPGDRIMTTCVFNSSMELNTTFVSLIDLSFCDFSSWSFFYTINE